MPKKRERKQNDTYRHKSIFRYFSITTIRVIGLIILPLALALGFLGFLIVPLAGLIFSVPLFISVLPEIAEHQYGQ
jgi:hypothetical protein